MEREDQYLEGVWGLEVCDSEGRVLGTIDSMTRTVGGPVRAIVKTPGRPRRFAFVDISQAIVRNGVVLVAPVVGG